MTDNEKKIIALFEAYKFLLSKLSKNTFMESILLVKGIRDKFAVKEYTELLWRNFPIGLDSMWPLMSSVERRQFYKLLKITNREAEEGLRGMDLDMMDNFIQGMAKSVKLNKFRGLFKDDSVEVKEGQVFKTMLKVSEEERLKMIKVISIIS